MAKSNKVIISCAVTGAIHTPTMSDALPVTPDEIAAQSIAAAEAGAAILHLSRARPRRRPPDARPGRVHAVPAAHQAVHRRRHQRDDRRRPGHDPGGTAGGGARGEARDGLAQHGLDELRHLPGRRQIRGLEIRLGRALSAHDGRFHFPQYIQRYRVHSERIRRRRWHEVRARVLRHRPPLQHGAFPRPRAAEAADLHPVDLRHPRRHRRRARQPDIHAAHRRPPVRR